MANKPKAESPEITAKAPEYVTKAEAPETKYTIKELVAAHKAFGVPKEIAAVALKLKGLETATEAEAKKIIEEFKKQEVK